MLNPEFKSAAGFLEGLQKVSLSFHETRPLTPAQGVTLRMGAVYMADSQFCVDSASYTYKHS